MFENFIHIHDRFWSYSPPTTLSYPFFTPSELILPIKSSVCIPFSLMTRWFYKSCLHEVGCDVTPCIMDNWPVTIAPRRNDFLSPSHQLPIAPQPVDATSKILPKWDIFLKASPWQSLAYSAEVSLKSRGWELTTLCCVLHVCTLVQNLSHLTVRFAFVLC